LFVCTVQLFNKRPSVVFSRTRVYLCSFFESVVRSTQLKFDFMLPSFVSPFLYFSHPNSCGKVGCLEREETEIITTRSGHKSKSKTLR